MTLEHSYDDWCLAQVARYLGRMDDYELLLRRSRNYLNLWNPAIGYFAPRNERGEWVEPFDPQLCDGFGARSYFAEVNACVHVFHVQHDIPQLIALMGGEEAFVRRLDEAYNRGPEIDKWKFMGRMPDATGLQGLMPAGNEPAFHVPWLYNYAGAAWKTQHRVRQIADIWFDDRPTGLSGDEDGGALTAWYVFAAMGFYPVNPASGEYALGSPIFERVEIALPGGRSFVIKSPGASKVNKYIRAARLNGERLTRPFITHEQIVQGGVLEFELVPRPWSGVFRLNIRGAPAPGFGSWNAEGQGALSAFLFLYPGHGVPVFAGCPAALFLCRECEISASFVLFYELCQKVILICHLKIFFAGRFRLILEPDTDIKFFNPEIV